MKWVYQLLFLFVLSISMGIQAEQARTYCITDSGTLSAQNEDRLCPINTYPVIFVLGELVTEPTIEKGINSVLPEVSNYYCSAGGKSGAMLKSTLNSIIKLHKRFNYQSVWEQLEYTDEDPDNTDNIILLYTGRSVPKNFRSGQTNDQNAWSREHVWAKSHGFPKPSQFAYTDIHHLRPADISVNNTRRNKDFD